jgi:hypothetical protein
VRYSSGIAGAILALVPGAVMAGVTVYEKDDVKIEVGGRLQLLYVQSEDGAGETVDELVFRRLRPYLAGSVTPNWFAKIEFDFGESLDEDEVQVKDAYARYSGWHNHAFTIGNSKTPFSREFMASSAAQQLVERSVVGDHNFGTPDRQLGLQLQGHDEGNKVSWFGAVGGEHHDPDVRRIDFDSAVSDEADWNQGLVMAARLDVHPRGPVPLEQGDFHSESWKYVLGAAAYRWDNDGDRNTYTDVNGTSTSLDQADLDQADGVALGGGVRGRGLSADVEWQRISGETVDPAFTGGVYAGGETDLDKLALEGGYMLPNERVEFVAGWDSLDASGYMEASERISGGLNVFLNQHKVKFQTTVQRIRSFRGVPGDDRNAFWGSFQFVF